MPDDMTTTDDETTGAPVAHDDIMKRLLDYQRSLRENIEAEGSEEAPRLTDEPQIETPAAATEEIVDLTAIEDAEAEGAAIQDAEVEGAAIPEDEDAIAIIDLVEEEAPRPEAALIAEAEAMRQRVAEEAAAELAQAPTPEATPEPEVEAAAALAPASETVAAPQVAELTERVKELEASLDRIATMLASVRSDFQDLTIQADERISEIEASLAAVRGSGS